MTFDEWWLVFNHSCLAGRQKISQKNNAHSLLIVVTLIKYKSFLQLRSGYARLGFDFEFWVMTSPIKIWCPQDPQSSINLYDVYKLWVMYDYSRVIYHDINKNEVWCVRLARSKYRIRLEIINNIFSFHR